MNMLRRDITVTYITSNDKEVKETFKEWTTTEDIIIEIIKPHKDFSDTINQHDIAAEFMEARNEKMTPRRVRKIIEELIEEGYPIISTPHHPNGGYCWGSREEEIIECVNRLRRKGIKILLRARRIKRNYLNEKAKRENIKQLNIFE